MRTIVIKIVMSAIAVAGAITPVLSSPVSKAIVKGGEKAAAELGFRIVGGNAVHGGAKLAAVTAERESAKWTAGGVAEGMAKHLTAKRVLAAGGGTALVVAAHEMSDGVQQMGEGVKAAVVANPELAVSVSDSVTTPVRYAIAISFVLLIAFFAWFLWPWLSLARSWSRFSAERRAAVLRGAASGTSDVAGVVDMNTSSPTSASSGFTRVELIIAVAGFLLLTIIGVWRIARCVNSDSYSSSVGSVDADHQKVQVAKRAEKVARLQKDYAAALDRHHTRFLADVESVAAASFGAVRDGIPGVVKKFGTFSRCKDLLVTLVKDKMAKGDRTGQSIKRDLEADFYRGLYDAHDQVKACLITFLKDVETERQTFRHEIEVELDSLELPGDEAFKALLTDGGERIENCKSELLEGQIVAAISAVVEATCIRFTVSTVTKILGKSAARMAGSAAVGAGAAVADGPFPFGDIIGGALVLGSTCWTAYDIWQATKVLPEELRKALRAVVDDCEAKTLNDFKNSGNEIYSAYRHVHK